MPEAIFLGKGFQVVHQKVFLDVDLASKSINGKIECIILPTDPAIQNIRFNCAQCSIRAVLVDNQSAEFIFQDANENISLSEPSSVYQADQLADKINGYAPGVREQGDLIIKLPSDCQITNEMQTRSSKVLNTEEQPSFKTLTVVVEYELHDPVGGFVFTNCEPDAERLPHAFTSNFPLIGSACSWMPCIDNFWSLCTWEFSISCHKSLAALREDIKLKRQDEPPVYIVNHTNTARTNAEPESETASETADKALIVVCSGELIENHVDPKNDQKRVVKFILNSPVSPQFISIAIGPFESIILSDYRGEEEEGYGATSTEVLGYCLPPYVEDVKNTCKFIVKAMDFFVKEYGSFPYTAFKMCFVDDRSEDASVAASLAILSNSLLYPTDIIDRVFDVTQRLTVELAYQWIGVNILPKRWPDLWLVIGLAHYITGLFLKNFFGSNDYRFRMRRRMEEICRRDISQAPIYSRPKIPIDHSRLDFIELKAPAVLFILEKRMTRTAGSLGLSSVIPKIMLQQIRGDLPNNCISTNYFLQQCEKTSHLKLDHFANEWIYGHGYPILRIFQRFNRKKMLIEMGINQVQANEAGIKEVNEASFTTDAIAHIEGINEQQIRPVFTGPMTIRIHGADGTPWEHIVEIRQEFTKIDIHYNLKTRRTRRGREPSIKKALSESMDNKQFGDVLQTAEEMADWKLEEFSNEDEEVMANDAFEWIRVDANIEWIGVFHVSQPEHMFISQLQRDWDVVAQADAVRHLAGPTVRQSRVTSTVLLRTLYDERYYYGVRAMAAEALTRCAREPIDWIGMFHLLKYFEHKFCIGDTQIPKNNRFGSLADYFIKCAIIRVLPLIRHRDGRVPWRIVNFILQLLRHNDNTSNFFSDCYYVATLVEALTSSVLPLREEDSFNYSADDMQMLEKVRDELSHLLKIERWIPSYQNVIAQAVMKAQLQMITAHAIQPDLQELLKLSRPENYVYVRLLATWSLMISGGLKRPATTRYLCSLITSRESYKFRYSLVRQMSHLLGFQVKSKFGSLEIKDMELLLFEEDSAEKMGACRQDRIAQFLDRAIEFLRDEYESFETLSMEMWKAALSSRSDALMKRELADVCIVLFKKRESLVLSLKVPSMKLEWTAIHEGNGKMFFKRRSRLDLAANSAIATKPRMKITLPVHRSSLSSAGPLKQAAPADPLIKVTTAKMQSALSIQSGAGPVTTKMRQELSDSALQISQTPDSESLSTPKVKIKVKIKH